MGIKSLFGFFERRLAAENVVRIVDTLSLPEKPGKVGEARKRMISLILELLPDNCNSVALLWLFDTNLDVHTATVWAVVTNGERISIQTGATRNLSTSIPHRQWPTKTWDQESSNEMSAQFNVHPASSCGQHIAKAITLNDYSSAEVGQAIIPIPYRSQESNEVLSEDLIGIIQVISDQKSIDKLFVGVSPTLLNLIARGIGARIVTGRNQRVLDAFEGFQMEVTAVDDVESICQSVAKCVSHFASATHCSVMTRNSKGELVTVARYPNSPSQIESKIAELRDAIHEIVPSQNSAHGLRINNAFDREALNQQLANKLTENAIHDTDEQFSLLSVPVVCKSFGNDLAVPLFSIQATTCASEDFLGGVFSRTDQLIAERIGSYLGGLIPGIQLRSATKLMVADEEMANLSKPKLTIHSGQDGRSDASPNAFRVSKPLRDLMPSIASIYFVEERRNNGTIDRKVLGREGPESSVLPKGVLLSKTKVLQHIHGHLFFVATVYDHLSEHLAVVARLRNHLVSAHEIMILELIASELRLRTLGEIDIADMKKQLMEVRHALRGSLHGMLSHFETALDYFHMAQETPEQRDQLIFKGAGFRKSLERAALAGMEVSRLFEDSRLALVDIQRSNLQLGSVDVGALISETIRIFRPELERRQLEVDYKNLTPPNTPHPICDRHLIGLVIFNLVDNAVKYCHKGTTILIRYSVDSRWWDFSISDDGRYISPDQFNEIFIPFHRAKAPKGQQEMPGTGLGLATAQKILQVHNSAANVNVVSTILNASPSQKLGSIARTTFSFRLPRQIKGGGTSENG